MICEEEGCCLEQWCLYVHRLKSGFSRVDFGPLFIHDFWPHYLGLDSSTGFWLFSAVSRCFQRPPFTLQIPVFVKTATEVGVRAIQNHKVIEWNTCWKCRLSEGTDDM